MSLELFKQWLTLNCDKPNTIETYYLQVNKLLKEIGEPLTQENINKYFIGLIDKKKSKSTFNIALSSLKKYLEFSKQTFDLPTQKAKDKRLNKYITKDQLLTDIIPYLSHICPKNYEQAEIVIKVFFLTGIRKEELITLKRQSFNFATNEIELINTKGKRDRLVPFDDILKKHLEKYFASNPEQINCFNITTKQINYIFEKINEQLNFPIKINARLFRHSCAIYLLKCGLSLADVQQILGHRDIKTTMIYAEPDFKHIKEVYKDRVKGF